MSAVSSYPVVKVTEIGEYVRHHSCDRRFKLEFNNRELAKRLPFAERLFNPIDPVLQEAGEERENEWENSLIEAGLSILPFNENNNGKKETPWPLFKSEVEILLNGQMAFGREVLLHGEIGHFRVEGRVDYILILWNEGRPILRLVEGKASRRDKTYHRIQVAIYKFLLTQLIETYPLTIGDYQIRPSDIECVVARIDEQANRPQTILELEPLNVELETEDILRLTRQDGHLKSILDAELDDLPYQLTEKCDGCVFNTNCLPESARLARLELLSLEPSTIRILKEAGVNTIYELAQFDLSSAAARFIQNSPGFTENLQQLTLKAGSRIKTLPDGNIDPESYEVQRLPFTGSSQVPDYIIDGFPLVRIYLCVDYDYSENRIGAISAHVTRSDKPIHTDFISIDGRMRPNPNIMEKWSETPPDNEATIDHVREIQGVEVIEIISSEWSGSREQDAGAERQLIQNFFRRLIDEISTVARMERTPIHFYVWSRSEMSQLIEACSRVDSQLLGHLRELLGCRDSLEQMIYSCLQDEIDNNFALGWTGRGLAVISSLRWYGKRYHWTRAIAGNTVALDQAFTQDIFDFKTDLGLDAANNWTREISEAARVHKFEIRSRFNDSLKAPYWRAVWGTLPSPQKPGLPNNLKNAIIRYNEAARPNYLREYLRARTHSLRWIEEKLRKNPEITKSLLNINELRNFSLGVDNAAQAAIDFLRLDQHVKTTDWIAQHFVPPAFRIAKGRTLPISNIIAISDNQLTATINLDNYDLDANSLEARCTITEGSFVRLSPCNQDPRIGQTFGQLVRGGSTCIINSLDWETQEVTLDILPLPSSDHYKLQSRAYREGEAGYSYATLDESPSDFVAGRVDRRLQEGRGRHVYQWFDPINPQIPNYQEQSDTQLENYEQLLSQFVLPSTYPLGEDQLDAILAGLQTRVQLLQGPPGTGKTTTTSAATLLRALIDCSGGSIILISAHTHTAVDNLLQGINNLVSSFSQLLQSSGITAPRIELSKVHSSTVDTPSALGITDFVADSCFRLIEGLRKNGILIIGGTTGAILKMATQLNKRVSYSRTPNGFQVSTLIVDEASMMVFPHFLALATLVTDTGKVMLAGDHRQLAPIVAHDWEREDRPPSVLYQPYASAYQAVRRIKERPRVSDDQLYCSALRITYRLPPIIVDLLSRLYRMDNINLEGIIRDNEPIQDSRSGSWESIWHGNSGLYLVLHNEDRSKQANEFEVEIIRRILESAPELPHDSAAIITPHRAQRTLLKTNLNDYTDAVPIIDTVERLQGGEKSIIIVSATVSDPSAISANVEFILDLNRSNVAFSRAQDRLIVVCSESLINHIPAEHEHYESALLWKSLRTLCSRQIASIELNESRVQMFTPPVDETL